MSDSPTEPIDISYSANLQTARTRVTPSCPGFSASHRLSQSPGFATSECSYRS